MGAEVPLALALFSGISRDAFQVEVEWCVLCHTHLPPVNLNKKVTRGTNSQ